MTIAYKESIRNDRLTLVSTAVDAGASAGKIKMYDGTRPATGAVITTQTLLATPIFNDPAFDVAASGSMAADVDPIIEDTSAVAVGTLSWFRVTDSNDNFVFDGDIGLAGSDLNVNTLTTSVGVKVEITSLVLTAGNA